MSSTEISEDEDLAVAIALSISMVSEYIVIRTTAVKGDQR